MVAAGSAHSLVPRFWVTGWGLGTRLQYTRPWIVFAYHTDVRKHAWLLGW